ncbi:hypothetical protein [Zoogloea sp.]|uniref:hypothetical protein n=1 Tax=Zoogloea sp. TaxID=49181 RepID=UPI0025D067D0|nr:hypothetical protein [Zoogloea sp.]MCK6396207.1 hypothetical protein [Zoogloea sp.]
MSKDAACGYRDFPGRRWLVVVLRAAHIAGVVGVGAGLLAPSGHPFEGFVRLMVASGIAMAALDAWSNPVWLREYAGLSLLVKFALLGWFVADESARPLLFWSILVFSVIFAHAPASFRHRRPGGG